MKVKYNSLGKAISIVFLLIIYICQSNLPGYTGGPLCFLDEMFGGCVGSCSDTPKCQEKLLNKDKSVSNTEKARSYLAKSLCFVDENFGSCTGECSGTPKCQEKLKKTEKQAEIEALKARKTERETLEKRRQTIASGIKEGRERKSKNPGEMRIASAQDREINKIKAEEIAQAQKKLVFVSYGGLQGYGLQNVVNRVPEKEKENHKSFRTYQYCVDKQGGKLSCAGRLGTPPEILVTANDALIKLAKKASYCEKHKTQKACQKLPNLIAINKRKEELKAKESIVASNNLW